MPASIAVVVCVYTEKRWDDILSAHRSLLDQSLPADEIVIVVDHNQDLFARLQQELPETRIVENSNGQGLSGARNTGISATTAELILFLDDDATADPDWIRHMTAPLADDSVVGVGGWAVPAWEPPGRPAWFPEAFLWVVGSSYEGQSRTSGPIRNPLGCAMTFRRSALASTHGFSDGIGRIGTHPLGCEETELAIRIGRVNPGTRMVGAPDAVVSHRVPTSRRTVRYFLSRCYWEGVSKAVVASHVGAEAALSSERAYTTKVLPKAFARGIGNGLLGRRGGFGSAAAIAAGLAATSTGYLRGRRSVAGTAAIGAHAGLGLASGNQVRISGSTESVDTVHTVSTGSTKITASIPGQRDALWDNASPAIVWCTEYDLATPTPGSTTLRPPAGSFGRARILVRYAGDPIQFVEFPLTAAGIEREDILTALSERSTLRLAQDVAEPDLVHGGPLVSVVVCTRDRGPELRNCLGKLQELSYRRVEIIIVDNAPSTVAGREAFDLQVGDDPRFRYVVEPRPGLSCARNRGLTEANGEIIAYTDDDVAVDPNWVSALVQGFRRRPDVACVTGLVCTAALQTPAEHYFDQRVSWADSCEPRIYDLHSHADDPLYPYAAGLFGTGASMAFTTSVLREIGDWDEALGAGTKAKGGEDLDMFVRVLTSGHAIAYEPSAIVWHHHRSDLAGLRRQIFGYGTGLSAFITKHLLDSDTRPALMRRIPPGIVKAVAVPRGSGSSATDLTDSRPAVSTAGLGSRHALMAREFAGMAMGPALYLMARRSNRTSGSRRERSAA